MLADLLRMNYDYNKWANTHIFDTAAQLSQEQLDAPGDAGHGSIRNTLFHMLNAQQGWFLWFDGSMDPASAMRNRNEIADFPDLASLREFWLAVEGQTSACLNPMKDSDAERMMVTGDPDDPPIPLWKFMLHVANHGTQHRSEVAAMLTAHGYSPGDIDVVDYIFEQATSAQAGA